MTGDQVDAHGFDKYGYLPFGSPERLAAALAGWLGAAASDDGDQAPAGVLVVRHPDGTEIGAAPLTGRLVNDLVNVLHRDLGDREQGQKSGKRQEEMTALIVKARRAGYEVGNLLAWSLATAAQTLYLGVPRLVHGRPGSWEAAIVMEWAQFGGTLPDDAARPIVERLAELLRTMGEAKEDGGQVVANVLGAAAKELGGLEALAGGDYWAHNLWNMAKALNYEDDWEPSR
jgi:hypothetical protein